MDQLIRMQATGNANEFAEKLGICRSLLMSNLDEMRSLGAPIVYDRNKKTYRYKPDYKLIIRFKNTSNETR